MMARYQIRNLLLNFLSILPWLQGLMICGIHDLKQLAKILLCCSKEIIKALLCYLCTSKEFPIVQFQIFQLKMFSYRKHLKYNVFFRKLLYLCFLRSIEEQRTNLNENFSITLLHSIWLYYWDKYFRLFWAMVVHLLSIWAISGIILTHISLDHMYLCFLCPLVYGHWNLNNLPN